jgi:hypothetical protein
VAGVAVFLDDLRFARCNDETFDTINESSVAGQKPLFHNGAWHSYRFKCVKNGVMASRTRHGKHNVAEAQRGGNDTFWKQREILHRTGNVPV